MEEVSLRAITPEDLPTLFTFYSDPDSVAMVGLPPRDEEAFYANRAKNASRPDGRARAIVVGGELAGDIVSWEDGGQRRLGYWLGKEYWGRGIATAALTAFLDLVPERPLYADVLRTNVGSLRVLQKCGFRMLSEIERGADHDPEEYTLRLG
ncbi:GNAT family N-acetyltransferase [Kribbella monticola]|uniref:GNAT family N-acetyltransferase n=1 Tax=Kribbella monticola TaxID=2185285 RepID=UPI000DD320BC|nr:GNAT family N-acetyltransferase [Kribbella monticola]